MQDEFVRDSVCTFVTADLLNLSRDRICVFSSVVGHSFRLRTVCLERASPSVADSVLTPETSVCSAGCFVGSSMETPYPALGFHPLDCNVISCAVAAVVTLATDSRGYMLCPTGLPEECFIGLAPYLCMTYGGSLRLEG